MATDLMFVVAFVYIWKSLLAAFLRVIHASRPLATFRAVTPAFGTPPYASLFPLERDGCKRFTCLQEMDVSGRVSCHDETFKEAESRQSRFIDNNSRVELF